MVVKEDELELACFMKNTWRVERGSGWLGEEEGDFLYKKLISPGSYYEPGLKVQNEPGLMDSGSCGRKSGGAQGISPGSKSNRD
jgi:hypothetical protein